MAAEFVRCASRRRQCNGTGTTTSAFAALSRSPHCCQINCPMASETRRPRLASCAAAIRAAGSNTVPPRSFRRTTICGRGSAQLAGCVTWIAGVVAAASNARHWSSALPARWAIDQFDLVKACTAEREARTQAARRQTPHRNSRTPLGNTSSSVARRILPAAANPLAAPRSCNVRRPLRGRRANGEPAHEPASQSSLAYRRPCEAFPNAAMDASKTELILERSSRRCPSF